MNLAVSGASGLVGGAVVAAARQRGDAVSRLVRRPPQAPDEIQWDPQDRGLRPEDLAGAEAVVHLAGENVAAGRWTAERKRRIRESRVRGTRRIAEALAVAEPRPRVLVCASAIGFYGDRGDEVLDETSPAGTGFLAEVCRDWEAASAPAREAGIRVVHLRIGVVLSRRGGALARMLLPFRCGLGGRIGSGRQWMSWIELGDLARAVLHAVDTDSLAGPVNAVAPRPCTNAEFTRALGRALGRPTLLPLPAVVARLALGEMAQELLLASLRVRPAVLEGSGFRFEHPDLEEALRHVLSAPNAP